MTYRLTARATPDGTVIFFETKIREEYGKTEETKKYCKRDNPYP
jgi:hypothetical protein